MSKKPSLPVKFSFHTFVVRRTLLTFSVSIGDIKLFGRLYSPFSSGKVTRWTWSTSSHRSLHSTSRGVSIWIHISCKPVTVRIMSHDISRIPHRIFWPHRVFWRIESFGRNPKLLAAIQRSLCNCNHPQDCDLYASRINSQET